RRGGDGQAHEVAAVADVALDVEPGQPQRAAGHEEEGGQPAHPGYGAEGPGVGEQGGGHAEGDDVGQAVQLPAELARGSRHARDPAVEHVEDDGPRDERRRLAVLAVEGLDDRPEAQEEVAGREQAGQDGRAPPEAAGPHRLAHGRSPTTVTPATARSPFCTRSRTSRGRKTSTRLPNLIIPTRSPAAT